MQFNSSVQLEEQQIKLQQQTGAVLSKFEVEDHIMTSRMELEQFILENEQYQQYILPDVLKTTLLNTDMADLFAQYSSRAVGAGKNSPEFSVKFYI